MALVSILCGEYYEKYPEESQSRFDLQANLKFIRLTHEKEISRLWIRVYGIGIQGYKCLKPLHPDSTDNLFA
ncbi:hypothetical protein DSM107007_36100 [Nostoc sp. PCC 7120 = FACHB-418]|uniref:Uncharacterized protein n=1 Tax=Trichormus variabilis NIES-23 TaxID=1973479 RepID=A0A1Z4KTA9_ANAVA|nr:hypothetical protein DSM107007_36100 [Nostoc sp. PCC 7120 = FACHB-418]BAY72250.1 hypothetical protein NIES23_50740 [Trichormus variabilis NIES-23]